MHAERAGWSASEIARACSTTDKGLPRIDFVAEAQSCPVCGGAVKTEKSRTRVVMTVAHGAFEAKEVLKQYSSQQPDCAGSLRSQALSQIVKPRQRYGYDLIVQVGLARYLRGKQREEIAAELYQQRRIELSTGSVSHLCDRFLVYIGRLHEQSADRLREAMQGGYPLHMDTTCDRGKGGLFICIDGFRQWVLAAGRVSTENESELSAIVKKTVDLFGDPIAVVRDMGEAGANAVNSLRSRGVVDLICHYHFLAAVGTKLLEQQHLQLMQIIRYSSVRSDLRTLLRTLRRYNNLDQDQKRFGAGTLRDELSALVLWILQADGKKEAPFPFALCHLDFVSRCRQSQQLVDQWVPCPRTQPEHKVISHLRGIVNRLERDKRVPAAVQTLNENQTVFNQLRDVLRSTNAQLPAGEARDEHGHLPALELLRLKQIQQAVEQYRQELLLRVSDLQRRLRRPWCPYAIVLKYLDRYGEHLFGHPAVRDEQGAIIQVVERTNNISEHFFGDAKQNLRRRVGRANLGCDLMQQPAQVAFEKRDGRVTYFYGLMPVFSHDENDLKTFRMITSQFCANGNCTQSQIVKAFGVPLSTVKRYCGLYQQKGVQGFYEPRVHRGAAVLTTDILQQAQQLLDEDLSVKEVSEQLEVKRNTLQKAVLAGRLHQRVKKTHSQRAQITTRSERSTQDSLAPMGLGATDTLGRVMARLGVLAEAPVHFEASMDVSNAGEKRGTAS